MLLAWGWMMWVGLTPAWANGWEATLARVSPAVVALEVTATRHFDTESASNSVGTGFVVDRERGLILTNRHMVHAGPVKARAVFLNDEEARLEAIYRDPVHDFGIYRFDPADVQFMEVVELQLAPDAAKVGMDIRVVGNDAGEKLSILDGTLARLDRNAPRYGGNTYNDFNTFYYQAASNTSGGSSGSPVLDVQGRVVALNAGGRSEAASSFYLPLSRVQRALELVRAGLPVTRGTMQTTFQHVPYKELGRLGLDPGTEATLRRDQPGQSGLLVVHHVLEGGPGHGILRPGDILTAIDGRPVADFISLEEHLDAHVGERVTVAYQRLGVTMQSEVRVGDLHAITPDRYLEFGRGVLHDLSYQQARNHNVGLGFGVYVASSGYALAAGGVADGDLITHIDGEPVASLAALGAALASKADGQRVRVRHAPIGDTRDLRDSVITVDRTWFEMQTCVRDDTHGTWPCTPAPPAPEAAAPRPPQALLPPFGDRKTRAMAPALVLVAFNVPYSTAGLAGQSFVGTGVVVDTEQGLLVVDRDTVPTTLGDLTLTFAGTVRIPGEVVYLHPVHNFAVVRYDPAALGGVPVAQVTFADRWIEEDDKVRVVGLDRDGHVVTDDADVEDVDALFIGPSSTPRFRDTHVEVARLARVERSVGGVVVDKRNRVVALWASYFYPQSKDRYFYGLPSPYIRPIVQALRAKQVPVVRGPGVEFGLRSLADARERGMSDRWIRDYVQHDPGRAKVLEVVRITGGSPASQVLRESDLILSVNGLPATRMRDVASWRTEEQLELMVLRDAQELAITLSTQPLSGDGVRRVLNFAGMQLHDPHPEVAAQRGVNAEGAYVAWYWYGSPAARDRVRPTRRIIRLNGVPVANLDDFVTLLSDVDPTSTVVLTLEDLDGIQTVRPIDLDLDFWPTEILSYEDGAWRRSRLAP